MSETVLDAAPPLWRAMTKAVLVVAGLVLAGLALRGLPDVTVRHGPLTFVVLAAMSCAVGLPRQVAAFGAGLWFGPVAGTALALTAQIAACAADFAWARAARPAWLARRLRRLEPMLARDPFMATLTLRLLPVGNSVALSFAAGVSRIRALPFLAASLVGFVPQTVVFVLIGGGTRLGRGVQLGIGLALLLASVTLAMLLWRRAGWTRNERAV